MANSDYFKVIEQFLKEKFFEEKKLDEIKEYVEIIEMLNGITPDFIAIDKVNQKIIFGEITISGHFTRTNHEGRKNKICKTFTKFFIIKKKELEILKYFYDLQIINEMNYRIDCYFIAPKCYETGDSWVNQIFIHNEYINYFAQTKLSDEMTDKLRYALNESKNEMLQTVVK